MSKMRYVGLGRFGRGYSSRLPVIGHLGDSGSGLTPPDQMDLQLLNFGRPQFQLFRFTHHISK
jgi:hypothetical protein